LPNADFQLPIWGLGLFGFHSAVGNRKSEIPAGESKNPAIAHMI
jgi:hypothetical protein